MVNVRAPAVPLNRDEYIIYDFTREGAPSPEAPRGPRPRGRPRKKASKQPPGRPVKEARVQKARVLRRRQGGKAKTADMRR